MKNQSRKIGRQTLKKNENIEKMDQLDSLSN